MASKKRKSYTLAHRREAARLVIDTGRPIAHLAREIGVGEQQLGRWVALARARRQPATGDGCRRAGRLAAAADRSRRPTDGPESP
jgi:transposase-like protein